MKSKGEIENSDGENIAIGRSWRRLLTPICWVIGHRKMIKKGHGTIIFEGCKTCHAIFSWW